MAKRKHPVPAKGHRFGNRTVVRETSRDGKNQRRFLCQCDCGHVMRTTELALRRIKDGKQGPDCLKCGSAKRAAARGNQ